MHLVRSYIRSAALHLFQYLTVSKVDLPFDPSLSYLSKSTDTMAESKAAGDHIEQSRALHEQELGHEPDVIVLDTGVAHLEKGAYSSLKLARDGHTVLVPQPTEDPNDPLNWSWTRKHLMLAIVSTTAFLGDYGSGSGIPLIVLQGWFHPSERPFSRANSSLQRRGMGSHSQQSQ